VAFLEQLFGCCYQNHDTAFLEQLFGCCYQNYDAAFRTFAELKQNSTDI
jgi:hypothetical protein